MATTKKAAVSAPEPKGRPLMYLAEYDTTHDVMHAAEQVRDAGYERWDVHTPFPVHGMDRAMGMRDSPVGWIVLVMGLTGITTAFVLMWWTNGLDYPLVIGGKPGFSIVSMAPVMFELTVLLSAFGAVFGMFGLNQLPKHWHPIFYSSRFERATDDKFFISIEASDGKFDREDTRSLLEKTHPTHIELLTEETEEAS
jgi:hypothetical protein